MSDKLAPPSLLVTHATKPFLVNTIARSRLPAGNFRLYEAGGGSRTILDDDVRARATIVVVDISPEQIERCDYANEAIVGDVEVWERRGHFDIVCCNNVLEHVPRPEAALDRMMASLAPGGLLVVAGPIATSFQGWVTRLMPHAFHVWFYRRIQGSKHAGKPGHAPFPVHFAAGSGYDEMLRILAGNGLEIVLAARYVGFHTRTLRSRSMALYGTYAVLCGLLKALTLGFYDPMLSEFFLIAERRGPRQQRPDPSGEVVPAASRSIP